MRGALAARRGERLAAALLAGEAWPAASGCCVAAKLRFACSSIAPMAPLLCQSSSCSRISRLSRPSVGGSRAAQRAAGWPEALSPCGMQLEKSWQLRDCSCVWPEPAAEPAAELRAVSVALEEPAAPRRAGESAFGSARPASQGDSAAGLELREAGEES